MGEGRSRRDVLKAGVVAAAAFAAPRCFRPTPPPPLRLDAPRTTPWPEANAILDRCVPPEFPPRTLHVTEFGAKGDGRRDDTPAFLAAIGACHRAGGGRVVVPAGEWRVGALRLLSGINLYLEQDATLAFSEDASLYPVVLTRYEGIECVNRSPMIYAHGETSVAVTGEGTLDASHTVEWNRGSDREGVLESLVARGVAPRARFVAGRLRTSFVQPYRCSRVLIQGVLLRGAQFWQVHPVLCSTVAIDGVTTSVGGPNTDGCDPESCTDVVVRGCTLASGDDNIALKSGRDEDGRRVGVPCRNVVVLNCQVEGRFGFICCGSEQSGGIHDVYAFDNRSYGRGVGNVLWVKSNTKRGGATWNVHVDGFTGSGLRGAVVLVTMEYDDQRGAFPPAFGELRLRNLTVDGAPRVLDVKGGSARPNGPIEVSDSRFTRIEGGNRIVNASGIDLRGISVNGKAIRGQHT
jgi:polygalacturonase